MLPNDPRARNEENRPSLLARAVFDNTRLSRTAKLLGAVMAFFNEGHPFYCQTDKLALLISSAEPTLRQARRELERFGHLLLKRNGRRICLYVPTLPGEARS